MPARPSTTPSPAASPARRAALALLEAVLDRRRPLEEALDALPGGLAPRDRSAAPRLLGCGAGALSAPRAAGGRATRAAGGRGGAAAAPHAAARRGGQRGGR